MLLPFILLIQIISSSILTNGQLHNDASIKSSGNNKKHLAENLCGNNLKYNYERSKRKMIIQGHGPMYNYVYPSSYPSPRSSPFFVNYSFFISSIELPDTITTIGDYAFTGLHLLETINIPESVIEIGNGALAFCPKLNSSITIPNVKKIGFEAFSECNSLTTIQLSKNVEI